MLLQLLKHIRSTAPDTLRAAPGLSRIAFGFSPAWAPSAGQQVFEKTFHLSLRFYGFHRLHNGLDRTEFGVGDQFFLYVLEQIGRRDFIGFDGSRLRDATACDHNRVVDYKAERRLKD